MTTHHLEGFFAPRSVVVVGATERPHSIGATLLLNLTGSGFAGRIMAVNPSRQQVFGVPCWPSVQYLPQAPDLAVVCTPAASIPGIINDLGVLGTRAVVIITAGLGRTCLDDGRMADVAALQAAEPFGLRIMGPNCLGLLVPATGLNASFAPGMAAEGGLAFVSQSGALATAMLDWGSSQQIGFSAFLSIGESLDVDLADLIEYLGNDPATHAILLYIESIKNPQKFIAAARRVALSRPLVAVKSGRVSAGAKAAFSHTGALAGDDDIVEAVLRHAGILRVNDTAELFVAARTLSQPKRFPASRVVIMTNGGGAGVMATDALIHAGGTLANLAPATLAALDAKLPATWSRANPVDMIGDSPVSRYVDTLEVLLAAPEVDTILFLHAPTAIVDSLTIARALVPLITNAHKCVLSCFLGGTRVAGARNLFAQQGLPDFETPEQLVQAHVLLARYARVQASLETWQAEEEVVSPDWIRNIKVQITTLLGNGIENLDADQSRALLEAAGFPTISSRWASTPEDASEVAASLGFPVALKISSSEITHKSDVGGVALDLKDSESVRLTANAMLQRIALARPEAKLAGFVVQPMAAGRHERELIIGISRDPVFGPVVMFGHGGIAVEVIHDRSMELPPIRDVEAIAMMQRTQVWALLKGYRNVPAVDVQSLAALLTRISALACACPEIQELDLNPVLAGPDGVRILDARIRLKAVLEALA